MWHSWKGAQIRNENLNAKSSFDLEGANCIEFFLQLLISLPGRVSFCYGLQCTIRSPESCLVSKKQFLNFIGNLGLKFLVKSILINFVRHKNNSFALEYTDREKHERRKDQDIQYCSYKQDKSPLEIDSRFNCDFAERSLESTPCWWAISEILWVEYCSIKTFILRARIYCPDRRSLFSVWETGNRHFETKKVLDFILADAKSRFNRNKKGTDKNLEEHEINVFENEMWISSQE